MNGEFNHYWPSINCRYVISIIDCAHVGAYTRTRNEVTQSYLAALELPIVLRPADVRVGHRAVDLALHGVLDVRDELFRLHGDVYRCRFHCVCVCVWRASA